MTSLSPKIPFNKPYMTGKELQYIAEAHAEGVLAGDGSFTRRCQQWLKEHLKTKKALLTHSCTAALEMTAILADIQPGDEVIMPSYTFVSTANAFVLRGGVPVFVDIRKDTLNIDETRVKEAITSRTKAIVVVHYAGVACEMDTLMKLAEKNGLLLIEDAAHGIMSTYKGRPLGSIGHLGCLSFHETKNILSGRGGALLINDPRFFRRAEILREMGTNRCEFLRGQADHYSWQDIGSSFALSEMSAAFLWAQIEEIDNITRQRLSLWNRYHQTLAAPEKKQQLQRPLTVEYCRHNAHMYYILLPSPGKRSFVIQQMKNEGIQAVFHYVPLHLSPAGKKFARVLDELPNTESLSERLLRLPLWLGVDIERVTQTLFQILAKHA